MNFLLRNLRKNVTGALCVLLLTQTACSQKQESLHGRLGATEDGAVSMDIEDAKENEVEADPEEKTPEVVESDEKDVPDYRITSSEQALVKKHLKSKVSNLAFLVVDAKSLEVYRSYQPEDRRILASLTKVITAIGALENIKNVNTGEIASMLKTSHNGKASRFVREAAVAIDGTKVKGKPFTGAATCPSSQALEKEAPAAESVFEWLKSKTPEANWTQAKMKDGAGCNYSNRMTAFQLVEALHFADQRGERYKKQSFEELLSIAGRDGTWRKRNTTSRGRIFAKTGTLSAVSNLSGYFYARQNGEMKKYYFVVFVNKPKGSAQTSQARSLIEALLRHWIQKLNQSDLVA